jgi:hypothetical protein
MNDETRNLPIDGFDDAGDAQQSRVIVGEKLSFSNEGTWVDPNENEFPSTRELVVTDLARVLQKWVDQKPAETIFLTSADHPDVEALNERCPKSEWSEDMGGKLRGPYQIQSLVYAVDLETMARFTYPTGTVGGNIAINDLREAVKMMRRFRGPGVYPVVTLGAKFMKTKFGGRQRPHFVIKRWFTFGPDGGAPVLPPSPQPSLLPSPAPAAAAPLDRNTTAAKGVRTVEEPSLREELNDDIDF